MKKLYENHSYQRECETTVVSCVRENDKIIITLAEGIFFPEEGGQYADTGDLSWDGRTVRLRNGKMKKGEVYYEVESEIPAGTRVSCQLDWEQRYTRMQQHTGEHILTGLIHNRYGYTNVGFHLSDDAPVTLDVSGPLTMEQAMEMETLANEVIYQNVPVTASYPTKEELASIEYRSKIEIEGQVRLITVEGVDVCACCAPHVARTGEVGLIKIVSLQNYKGGVRLGILCGKRALLHYREQLNLMNRLANSLSTRPEQVYAIVTGQKEELTMLRSQLSQMKEQILLRQAEELLDANGVCLFADADTSAVVLKNIYNTMTARFSGYVGVFAGDEEKGYRYNAGSGSLDSRELSAKMRESLGAKGGGSREMIQGKVNASREQIEAFFRQL